MLALLTIFQYTSIYVTNTSPKVTNYTGFSGRGIRFSRSGLEPFIPKTVMS